MLFHLLRNPFYQLSPSLEKTRIAQLLKWLYSPPYNRVNRSIWEHSLRMITNLMYFFLLLLITGCRIYLSKSWVQHWIELFSNMLLKQRTPRLMIASLFNQNHLILRGILEMTKFEEGLVWPIPSNSNFELFLAFKSIKNRMIIRFFN